MDEKGSDTIAEEATETPNHKNRRRSAVIIFRNTKMSKLFNG